MLTEAQIEELRVALQDAEHRLLLSAQQAFDITREGSADETHGDSIDISSNEELRSTALRLRDREQKLLAKIREALARLDDGIVDECESCGGGIQFKRLMVRPMTTLCIDCKERAEEQERREATAQAAGPVLLRD